MKHSYRRDADIVETATHVMLLNVSDRSNHNFQHGVNVFYSYGTRSLFSVCFAHPQTQR